MKRRLLGVGMALLVLSGVLAGWLSGAWFDPAVAQQPGAQRRTGGAAARQVRRQPGGSTNPADSAEAYPDPVATWLAPGTVCLRVELGSITEGGRRVPTVWDGSLQVTAGTLRKVAFWHPDPRNKVEGNSWKATTLREIPWNTEQRARGHEAMPLQDAALLIELADCSDETVLEFDTAQGKASFSLREIPFGTQVRFLRGLMRVSRAAQSGLILSAPTEDDFPVAATDSAGRLHVVYVAFTHGKRFRVREQIDRILDDYSYLAEPAGGDQLWLLREKSGDWEKPMAITPPGQDIFRPAIAIDGQDTIWVIWSAQQAGNWDLYARWVKGDQLGEIQRLTTDLGPDIFAVATTDAEGRVWLAWQAFRNGRSDILAMRQEGNRFGAATTVCGAPRNQWTPAIAAAKDGRVAVVWDSYEKGDYDVFARIWSHGQWGPRITVAGSLRAEMRPSATFDSAGRLWVAFEDSPEGWGKDWGALEKEGVPLYQGRTIAVRIWADGKLWAPAEDPATVFVANRVRKGQVERAQRLALPRLATDRDGRIWLAVRSPRLGTRVGVGTTWFTHVTWFDGERWADEIPCPLTDNLLDNRGSLVPLPSGEMVLVTSTDKRFATAARLPEWYIRELRQAGQQIEQGRVQSRWPDSVNGELMMARLGTPSVAVADSPKLELVETVLAEPDLKTKKELEDVARAREYRVQIGGKTLRLWRGEFHRHTEISSDGGGDGMLMDMWRYALDAAELDWVGNGDHDNGNGREYSWWITQKTTDLFNMPGVFTPVFSYERSVSYPDGHRNVVFARRGIRTLPRLQGGFGKPMDELPFEAERPSSPDTQQLYRYLAYFDGVCASHTSGTNMGTDWRDNNPKVEPIVEIYQGCRQNYEMPGAPRSNTADNSIGGWRPYGFVSLALKKGYRLGFQASSDHISTHISYCSVWVSEPTREGIVEGMKRRHVFGATDNIIADVRCGDYFMGDEFTLKGKPTLQIRLIGTQPFAKVHIIKDGNYVHTVEPSSQVVEFQWTDFEPTPGTTSFYYVRGEQENGELVWVSPMWITYQGR